MQILFVISLLFAILVSIFAVMNSDTVTIRLLWREYPFSQAIVILGSASVGAIIVALLGTFNKIKSSFKIRELNNKVKSLEKEIDELKPKPLDEIINESKDEAIEEDTTQLTKENNNMTKKDVDDTIQ